jgi:hypothetical protein
MVTISSSVGFEGGVGISFLALFAYSEGNNRPEVPKVESGTFDASAT